MIGGFMFVIGALVAFFLVMSLITAAGEIGGQMIGNPPLPKRSWQPEEDYEPRLGDIW